MYCIHCGYNNKDNKYCKNCGKKLVHQYNDEIKSDNENIINKELKVENNTNNNTNKN